LDLKGRNWQEIAEDCTTKSFITCTHQQILFRWSYQRQWDGRDMQRAWERWKFFAWKTWREEATRM